jgi:RimJ/RimL family protein N-acetyltransferase
MSYKYSIPLLESKNITVKSNYIQDKLLPTKIQTNRLIMEPIWKCNVNKLYDLYNSQCDKSTKYVPKVDVESLQDIIKLKKVCQSNYNDNTSCRYTLRIKETNILIGFMGCTIDWDKKSAEYYIWLKQKHWGQEYAKERGVAFTSILFEVLDLDSVKVTVILENENSIKSVWKYMRELGGCPTGLNLNSHNITDSSNKEDAIEFTVTKKAIL